MDVYQSLQKTGIWLDWICDCGSTGEGSGCRNQGGGYFKGTSACLSALLAAGRNEEILELLALAPYKFWHNRQWGVRALLAMGNKGEALRYTEEMNRIRSSALPVKRSC